MEEPADEPPPRSSAGTILILDPDATLDHHARAWLQEYADRASEAMPVRGEVRARLAHDAEMARAHEKYKGLSGPTDVLTFDLSDSGGPLDVDLMVCTDVARRSAAEHGHTTEAELLLYIIHGILHCCGYDDAGEEEAARMHRAEDDLLQRIGVGPVYAAARAEEES